MLLIKRKINNLEVAYVFADFFYAHRIFTTKELRAFLSPKKKNIASHQTLANLLNYHEKHGHIIKIRRGLYYSIPFEAQGRARTSYPVDPYLVASKLKDDAIIAYYTALALHGKAYSYSNIVYYLTSRPYREHFVFQGITYKAVHIPAQLLKKKKVSLRF